jgi:glycosyltransferase involved in cell wall biosynthesis
MELRESFLKIRCAVVSTHVIQHFAPLYRALAERDELEVCVFYASRSGLDAYCDPGFNKELAWDSDLTTGYAFEFLPRASVRWKPGFFRTRGNGLEDALDVFKPAVIFVFGYTPLIMIRAMVYARRRACGLVMMTDSELVHARPVWKTLGRRMILPLIFASVDRFLTIGDSNEICLSCYGVSGSRLVRGGYPTDEASFLAARQKRGRLRAEVRTAWDIRDDEFVALFMGKLIPRKRPEDVLNGIARLSQRTRLPVTCVFAGDGELRAELERRSTKRGTFRAIFLGFVNQSSLGGVYAAADVLVHPAEFDPHPLAITEAVQVGLPVVVSDRVGAVGRTDTARPGINARVYPCGDVGALAETLAELAENREVLALLGEGTERVARETGLQACVEGFLRAVREAATGRLC